MGLFVIDTVASGGQVHKVHDSLLKNSFENLENFIRGAYAKPSKHFDLHIHWAKKCTKSNDVLPISFNTFMRLNMVSSESTAYYVCFIPKSDNPPPQIPRTPISEQERSPPLPPSQSVGQNPYHNLETSIETEASSSLRRAMTASIPPGANTNANPTHYPEGERPLPVFAANTSSNDQSQQTSCRTLSKYPISKRPLTGESGIPEQRKRAKTIATDLPRGPEPAAPRTSHSISQGHHTRKKLPEFSIIPPSNGSSGSTDNPIVLEPESLDAETVERAYKFFVAHQLPDPYRNRFEVGHLNRQKSLDRWKLDQGGRTNKVSVQFGKGKKVSHFCMKEDTNDGPLTPPTLNRVGLDKVSYWPEIQMMHDITRLKDFFTRYNEPLMSGVPFEEAQPIAENLDNHDNNTTSNGASKVVVLRIPPGRLAGLTDSLVDQAVLHGDNSRMRERAASTRANSGTGKEHGSIVKLSIKFKDLITIYDHSRPLNFAIKVQARIEWTAQELTKKLLRERINDRIMNTPEEELTSEHHKKLINADLTVYLVTRIGLFNHLFNSSDLEILDPWWLRDAVIDERTISLVVSMSEHV
ncbi:sentrin sumo-specific protease [Diplodia corticola]|uniref:Sentrin sumo-specific protease n=1 Tax=Diplodia corticola TaxID=236234 RepID=A0A1J9RU59_9PEZI|nr:sentrin sumo-specific protease [Diplodia corticola]OJD31396.1 sentrin sumo-specific protease [Diplodia corticola]